MTEIIKQTRLSILVILLAVATWLLMLPVLPNFIGLQFTLDGEVVWGTNKYLASLIIVGIMIAVYILSVIKPVIDPEKSSYAVFSKYFTLTILAAELLIYLVGCLLMLQALETDINLVKIVMLTVGVIFIITGNYLPKVPTTWFVGIRNPWSLSDKDIWNMTHRFTGMLYIIAGFLFILSSLLNFINMYLIVSLVAFCIIVPHLYSFILFKSGTDSL